MAGQGAPLVPLYHGALVRKAGRYELPVVLVTSAASPTSPISAGTACSPSTLARATRRSTTGCTATPGRPVDENGDFARTGKVDDAALNKMLANTFFDAVPPKSLDRLDFGTGAVEGLSPQGRSRDAHCLHRRRHCQGARTFRRYAECLDRDGRRPSQPNADDNLRARVNAPVLAAEDAGWNGDFIEAKPSPIWRRVP
ncbi:MAG: anhydro-N-acetylmuramic acid kinase [Rhizomicrobium sp.]